MTAETQDRIVRAEGFTHEEMVNAVERNAAQFVELVRSLPPEAGRKPVPGLEWNVMETAVHLIGIAMRGSGDRRRAPSARELGALNLVQIREIDEDDLATIADQLEARIENQLGFARMATGDEPFELHAGLVASVKTALSYELFDFIVHGLDIARATDSRWDIEPRDAALTLLASLPALEPWVLPEVQSGAKRSVSFTFPQIEPSIAVHVGDGSYAVTLDGKVAAEIDPVETLLAISKRIESSDAIVSRLASWYLPT